jgi:folylpolyglutamate synthase/dihydropteroate synthase
VERDRRDDLHDGAHNPDGATTHAQAVDDLRPHLAPGRITLLTAVMADKDVDGIIRALIASPAIREAAVVATQVDARRALPAGALAARWRAVTSSPTRAEPDIDEALERALRDADGPVVVAGSLYLVGAVRSRLVDDPALREPEPVA